MGEMVKQIAALQDYESYQDLHWEGSFEDYLQIVREKPKVTRNAFQRLYDMVVSYGEEEYIDNKKKLIRYPFFKDPIENGKDVVKGGNGRGNPKTEFKPRGDIQNNSHRREKNRHKRLLLKDGVTFEQAASMPIKPIT